MASEIRAPRIIRIPTLPLGFLTQTTTHSGPVRFAGGLLAVPQIAGLGCSHRRFGCSTAVPASEQNMRWSEVSMTIAISGVGHLVLRVRDLRQSLAFYELLGLHEVARRDFVRGAS